MADEETNEEMIERLLSGKEGEVIHAHLEVAGRVVKAMIQEMATCAMDKDFVETTGGLIDTTLLWAMVGIQLSTYARLLEHGMGHPSGRLTNALKDAVDHENMVYEELGHDMNGMKEEDFPSPEVIMADSFDQMIDEAVASGEVGAEEADRVREQFKQLEKEMVKTLEAQGLEIIEEKEDGDEDLLGFMDELTEDDD